MVRDVFQSQVEKKESVKVYSCLSVLGSSGVGRISPYWVMLIGRLGVIHMFLPCLPGELFYDEFYLL